MACQSISDPSQNISYIGAVFIEAHKTFVGRNVDEYLIKHLYQNKDSNLDKKMKQIIEEHFKSLLHSGGPIC